MARFAVVVALAALALLALGSDAYVQPNGVKDMHKVIQCLQQDGRFKTFLRYFRKSGFESIVGRYISAQPVTLLVPTDRAFGKIPQRFRARFKGATLIKVLELHMIVHKLPAEYLQLVLDTAFFDSVLGDYIYKQPAVDSKTILLSTERKGHPGNVAVVVDKDYCGKNQPTVTVQVIDTVLLPKNLFSSSAQ